LQNVQLDRRCGVSL